MAARNSSYLFHGGLVLLLALLASYLYGTNVQRASVVLGVFRSAKQSTHAPEDLNLILDTTHCEDLHYHESSKLLFTACEDDSSVRHAWFPPLENFDRPDVAFQAQGSFKVIDPESLRVTKLRFENFKKPFITHGIDVLDDPDGQAGSAVYIFAVNHRPNPERYHKANTSATKSYSVVEVFHHSIGSGSVRHVRSIWHPLITTPNDVLALSPTSFFITNDHFYREGVARLIEDIYHGAKWSNTVFVKYDKDIGLVSDDAAEVTASIALTGLQNNNGLGRGKSSQHVLIASAAGGTLHLGTPVANTSNGSYSITVVESMELDSALDNPSYFADPFSNDTYDRSGFVLGGLSNAGSLMGHVREPEAKDGVVVWMVNPKKSVQGVASAERWHKRLIFEDDGSRIRSCSAAVLVATKPLGQHGKLRARLFVTGFLSRNIIAVDVDLD